MKSLGADVIFALAVGSIDDSTPQEFGDSLSGFWVRQFDKSYQVGYAYGKEFLDRLKLEDSLPIPEETEEKRKPQRTMDPHRSSI